MDMETAPQKNQSGQPGKATAGVFVPSEHSVPAEPPFASAPGVVKAATFAEVIRNFLREPVPSGSPLASGATTSDTGDRTTGDSQGAGADGTGTNTKDRLRDLLERFCDEDPKAAFQSLAAYAFGKPVERSEASDTVAGVPEKFIELFREHASKL
jgi:hypothetical protein